MNTVSRVTATRSDPWAHGNGFDGLLLGTVAVILAFGSLMVASAGVANAGSSGPMALFGPTLRHLVHVAVGVAAMLLVSRVPVAWWEAMGKPLLLLGLGLLVVLFLPGIGLTYNGSTRWLDIAGFGFQPAEPAKLFMVVYAAGYLTRKHEVLGDFTHGVLTIGLVLAVVGLLLLLQPDFGSFVVIALTVGALLFLSGVRFWHFLLCALVGAGAMVFLIWSKAYRADRVTSFLDPWQDPADTSYQLVQGLIALGRGEWFGVGIGASVQKLYFLPHAETDFLLAVIGEELGFVGVCFAIVLYGILLWRSFAISRTAERIGKLHAARLAQGLSLLLVLQAMIHIGVNLGSLPTKGLTLPLMSHGGSSLITSCIAVGMLLAIERSIQPGPGRTP
ncbi:MAG: putative peptidoglycan glycosyltransferase FtsW [Gammaproteobacteria bacterium]|nr:putative peptidoglycan glycosyltransferase FtsW [Gammaproteobacteria bacterium]